ncbi:unnamed protein product, partial [Rotaria sp. Silwood1]
KILNEQDIQNFDHIHELTSVFIHYLSRTVHDSCYTLQDIPAKHLLESLKGM